MLRSYVPLGAAAAICLAASACAAPSNDATAAGFAEPPPEIEADLTLSVDAIDVRHGSLRIEASMEDGSPDVSMWLGPTCPAREVGRGFATRAGFAWSLSRDDVARAIECSLVVRVRAIDDEGRRVRRTATLPVSVLILADDTEDVRLMRQESFGGTTTLTFVAPRRVDRMHVAGTVIGREADADEAATVTRNGRTPGHKHVARTLVPSTFAVGNDDLARSLLARRHLTVLGDRFLATVTIGTATLDVSEPAIASPAEAEPEQVPEVSGEPVDTNQGEGEGEGEGDYGYYDDGR